MSEARADTARRLDRLSATGPLRIAVLVSATGANLRTLLRMHDAAPAAYEVSLVASHAATSPALQVARQHSVEAWPGDFDSRCGLWSRAQTSAERARYRALARAWHDDLDARIAAWESENGALDLIVLAYHRWIEGNLLARFDGRMINQHPGDLTIVAADGTRVLAGNDPVAQALALGHTGTRTSCFLVDSGHDTGAILCQGPIAQVAGDPRRADAQAHETTQKTISDASCLQWTVEAFAAGRLALSNRRHDDGSAVVTVDGIDMPLGGWRLDGDA